MEFGFSQEQQEVRQLARKILSEQVRAETLAAYDEYQAPRFDRALWQQLVAAGLRAVDIHFEFLLGRMPVGDVEFRREGVGDG